MHVERKEDFSMLCRNATDPMAWLQGKHKTGTILRHVHYCVPTLQLVP